MWAVLVALELTSNGSITRLDSSGVSSGHPSVIPRFGAHDAPHLYYAVEYDRTRTDDEREQVLQRATNELRAIRHSSADRTKEETKDQRDARMVEEGEGFEALEVARKFNCGVRDVHRAREAAGRDTELGKPPVNGKALDLEERRRRAREMEGRGMSARQIGLALGIHTDTVRDDLGRRRR